MPNTPERTRFTSTPSACTISAFCEVARISRPSRVRSSSCQMARATTMPAADQEQAIDRERLVHQEDDAGEQRRRRHLQRVRAPEQPDGLAHDQREAEGHHQEGVCVAPVEAAQDAELERRAEQPDQRAAPAPAPARNCPSYRSQRIADEGAQHVERAMREIDDAHDAEDQRQTDAEEEQQCGLRQRVDALGQQECERATCGSTRAGSRRGA